MWCTCYPPPNASCRNGGSQNQKISCNIDLSAFFSFPTSRLLLPSAITMLLSLTANPYLTVYVHSSQEQPFAVNVISSILQTVRLSHREAESLHILQARLAWALSPGIASLHDRVVSHARHLGSRTTPFRQGLRRGPSPTEGVRSRASRCVLKRRENTPMGGGQASPCPKLNWHCHGPAGSSGAHWAVCPGPQPR